ncbi:MAG: hypothetical protein ACLTUR_11235 [Paraclostridium sordellii]
MMNVDIINSESSVYVKVEGKLSDREIKSVTSDYKQKIKGIKTQRYNLIIEVDPFEYDKISTIKNTCMMFYKTGYKNIYLVDPMNYIMSNIKLNSIERKVFLNSIKIVNSKNDIK